MSGTSGDGIDASVIISDGKNDYKVIQDEYVKYENDLFQEIHEAKEKINIFEDLSKYKDLINKLEKKNYIIYWKINYQNIEKKPHRSDRLSRPNYIS